MSWMVDFYVKSICKYTILPWIRNGLRKPLQWDCVDVSMRTDNLLQGFSSLRRKIFQKNHDVTWCLNGFCMFLLILLIAHCITAQLLMKYHEASTFKVSRPPLQEFDPTGGEKISPGPLDKRLDWMRKKLVSWQKAFVGRSVSRIHACSNECDELIYVYVYLIVSIYTYTCKLTIWVCSGTTTILANHDFVWIFSNNMSSHFDGSQWTTVIHHCFFKKSCASLLKKPWN